MPTAYLFPGQGSQHVGMGRELYQREPAARAVFDRADELLGFPLTQLCFEGPEEALTDTVHQQPAVFVTSVAAWKGMAVTGWPPPDYVTGHSLGELAALVAAGSVSFDAGLRLVQRRGELMQAAGAARPGGMAALLGVSVEQADAFCRLAAEETGRPVQVANDNCPGQVVISGDSDALAVASRLAREAGVRKVTPLAITIAAHSPLMAGAAAAFGEAVEATTIGAPDVPIIGNVTARPLATPAAIRDELKAQLTSAVRWADSMNYLLQQGVDNFVEVGPGDVLTKMMKRIDRNVKRSALLC